MVRAVPKSITPPVPESVRAPEGESGSTARVSSNRRAVEAATAVAAAAVAAAAAVRVVGQDSPRDPVPQSSDTTEAPAVEKRWPLQSGPKGEKLWYARDFPGLDDGVYSTVALVNRGVSVVAEDHSIGQLQGWSGTEAPLRRAKETGTPVTIIFWE